MEPDYLITAAHLVGLVLGDQTLEVRLSAINDIRAVEDHFPSYYGPADLTKMLIKMERYQKAPKSIRNKKLVVLGESYGPVFEEYMISLPHHFKHSALRQICAIIHRICSVHEYHRIEQYIIITNLLGIL
ncbi:unnamed protein product [Nezara viridula]|uniref:Uncharacterized protein n=1 Tax=Nezara viridula TaxID=85310 RepID=A0A9P0H6Z2_NEZVI|nr:unnamed protein product [Nezara viridula]CAH1396512.1 unnamed protein product [Nezara viridula]